MVDPVVIEQQKQLILGFGVMEMMIFIFLASNNNCKNDLSLN